MSQVDALWCANRSWLRMAGWCLAAGVLAVVAFSGVSWQAPWSRLLQVFGVTMIFPLCIVPLAAIVLSPLARFVTGRFPFPIDWAILIAAMVVSAAVGSLIAIGILAAVGYIAPGHAMRTWLAGSLRVSVILTLIFGISATAIGALRGRLERTTVALRTKERDEAEARRLAAEAQLASLESRVQPHFLFNTLNSISQLIHDDPAGAERMTGQLAALLRSSLDSAPLVALEEELKVVGDYLEIERVRFGDRLRYEITAETAAAAAPVPRLSVQTLVENSIKYAVAPRREGATVAVRAFAVDDVVRVEVTDNGPGFASTNLPAGHGLDLLRSRLAMAFGNSASLGIESHPGRTTVVLELRRP